MTNPSFDTICRAITILMVLYTVLWSLLQTFNANPLQNFFKVWAQLLLYYLAFTMPWWALLAIMTAWSGLWTWWAAVLIASMAFGYFYSTVILPSMLRTYEQGVDLGLERPLRLAVLSNLKVGIFSGKPRHIRRWVDEVNDLDVEAVLITGDWLYYPGPDLVGQLMLLKTINKPVYTVMSRTDLVYQSLNLSVQGQPLLEDTLNSALQVLDIKDLSQRCVQSHEVLLCGWQDKEALMMSAQRQSVAAAMTDNEAVAVAQIIPQLKQADRPVIILAAHYDRVYELPKTQPRPLVIAGDGRSGFDGKARPLTMAPIASRHPVLVRHQGLHQHELAQVYVAHGVGMSRWPFRLSYPAIDILSIR